MGPSGVDPTNAFRIGTDGLTAPLPGVGALASSVTPTLPQPYFPGVGGNASAGDGTVLDPNFRPNRSDAFDFTIQRELSSHVQIEVGYIGRIIRNEYQQVDIDAVAHMTTLNGQTFANAYANLYTALSAGQAPAAQPFFEAALGGPGSAFCSGAASCTAAVAANQRSNILSTRVYDLWSALSRASSWTLGRTLPSSPPAQASSVFMVGSFGYGNYNAAFLSLTTRDFHGVTTRSNFTWSRSMGTGAVTQSTSSYSVVDPWNIHAMYGPQSYDARFLYNLSMLYQPKPFHDQRGVLGRMLGGWSIAPLFTARSGFPLQVSVGTGVNRNCQSFGEMNCSSGNTNENAILVAPFTGGNSAHRNVTVSGSVGVNGNASRGGSGINMFSDPPAVYAEFRRPILGIDTTGGGSGVIRGFPTWNLDVSVSKSIRMRERLGLTFLFQFANVLNHFQADNTTTNFMNIDSPQTFGVVTDQLNTPRQMESGVRLHF